MGLPILSTALLSAIGLWCQGVQSGALAQSASNQVIVDYGALDALPAAAPNAPATVQLKKPGAPAVAAPAPETTEGTPEGQVAMTPPAEPEEIPQTVAMPEPTPPAPPPAAAAGPQPSAAVETSEPATPAAEGPTEDQPAEEQAAAETPAEAEPPAEQAPAEEAPAEAAPAEAVEQTPAEEAPAEEAPAEAAEEPATEAPADTAAVTPEAPADEEAEDEATEGEADEAPAEEDNTREAAPIPQGGIRIVFPTDLNEVPPEATAALDDLAAQMLADESMRIQIMCYSSGDQETESKARRKSLQRCINIRQYLYRKDVRTTRMDVRALGLKSEGQPADRVDIVPANS